MASPPAVCLLIALLAWAAASDLRSRTIPNACTVGGAMALGAVSLAGGAGPLALAGALAMVCVPMAVASLLRPGALGGGDVKLAALPALALGPAGLAALLLAFASAVAWTVAGNPRRPLTAIRSAVVPLAPFVAFGSAVAAALVG